MMIQNDRILVNGATRYNSLYFSILNITSYDKKRQDTGQRYNKVQFLILFNLEYNIGLHRKTRYWSMVLQGKFFHTFSSCNIIRETYGSLLILLKKLSINYLN